MKTCLLRTVGPWHPAGEDLEEKTPSVREDADTSPVGTGRGRRHGLLKTVKPWHPGRLGYGVPK